MFCGFFDRVSDLEGRHEAPHVYVGPGFAVIGIFHLLTITPRLDSIDRWLFAVLDRGFVWRSRYGLSIFGAWQEFCSTELLYRSYQQWCNETRVAWQMTRAQLGTRMTEIYEAHRPGREEIVGETESVPPGGQLEQLVVRQWRPAGYKLGSLGAARALFEAKRGVTGNWEAAENSVWAL